MGGIHDYRSEDGQNKTGHGKDNQVLLGYLEKGLAIEFGLKLQEIFMRLERNKADALTRLKIPG